jgi:hypothetical protein
MPFADVSFDLHQLYWLVLLTLGFIRGYREGRGWN